jgi:anaerobic ribonucleoside-triphosphate reductase
MNYTKKLKKKLFKMQRNEIWQQIELELRRAKKKFPNWPDHPAAQAGIVCEEAAELMQACLQYKYQRSADPLAAKIQVESMKEEAIQTAVTAIRFLENLK